MKKILVMIIAAVLCVPFAQSENKQLQKALKKEYKAKLKQLKKEKWELFGSSHTLEVALLKHYDQLASLGDDAKEVVGIAPKFKSKNVGKQQAINSACVSYAQQAGSHIKGRITSDMAANGDDPGAEFDHFYAAYERLVEKEIKGEMEESFSLIRCIDKKAGEYEMQTFFIINESAASRARIRAMENAMKESQAAQKHSSRVSEFVREGFDD
ncbi:MAG: hypothetical protein NC201_06850 [Prevotella sp.]|nr:hypothetical protein [Bacteroides sp.]MCM1366946.1 hypothetical protein [Prevotella sp.]MCM1437170.1 hypothetical protein [Prevotella sp.]